MTLRNGGAPRAPAPHSSSSFACSVGRTARVRLGVSVNSTKMTATALSKKVKVASVDEAAECLGGVQRLWIFDERVGSVLRIVGHAQLPMQSTGRSLARGPSTKPGVRLLSSQVQKPSACQQTRYNTRQLALVGSPPDAGKSVPCT